MIIASLPKNETQRLQALRDLDILDTPAVESVDRFTRLAASLLRAPISLLSLVDESRQWFKSRHGLNVDQTSRDVSFCAHAILDERPLVVPDALSDKRFADNPLVLAEPHIRFYAGAPLRTRRGYNIGTLCVIDYEAREPLDAKQEAILQDLAAAAMTELELRRAATYLERAESALRYSEARHVAVLNSVMDGIVTLDAGGTVLSVNPAVERMFGYPAADLKGRHLGVLIPALTGSRYSHLVSTLGASSEQQSRGHKIEISGQRQNRSIFPLELAVSALDLDKSRVFVCTMHDISERKANELHLLKAMENANEATRAKSGFLSAVSHELRTPLNAILGFGELLVYNPRYPLVESQKQQVEQILTAGRHLLHLVDDLLDLAKIESNKLAFTFERFDVLGVIEECAENLAPLAERAGTRFVTPSIAHSVHVYADRRRFKQVLLNFMSNALKFGRTDEPVMISVDGEGAESVRVSVTDSGPGIRASDRMRVFQAFDRLDADQRNVEGVGLGLAVSKGLIEQMGGTIGLHSEEGRGTTFWFELPAVAPACTA